MKTFLIFVSLSLGMIASAFASAAPVSQEEAATVLASLSQPSNPTASQLKAVIKAAKGGHLSIDMNSLQVSKFDSGSYQVHFYLKGQEGQEGSIVHISEVLVRAGKAYVFSFDIERLVMMQQFPGTSLGNN